MANQHPLLAKCRRQLGPAMGRAACENKVCFRWQHLETEPRQFPGHPIPFFITLERLRWKHSSSSKAAIGPAWAGRPSG